MIGGLVGSVVDRIYDFLFPLEPVGPLSDDVRVELCRARQAAWSLYRALWDEQHEGGRVVPPCETWEALVGYAAHVDRTTEGGTR